MPLVEAMYFSLPVVAFNAAAVGETLGESGLLLDNKEPAYVSRILRELQRHPELKEEIVAEQNRRLNDFDKDRIAEQFLSYIKRVSIKAD